MTAEQKELLDKALWKLHLLYAIGVDYDGCGDKNDPAQKSMCELVDELVTYSCEAEDLIYKAIIGE